MDVYSLTLLASMVLLAAAFLALAMCRLLYASSGSRTVGRLKRMTTVGSVGSLILVILSAGVHLVTGHLPGSPNAMEPFEFLLEHVSFLFVGVMATAVLYLGRSRFDSH